MARKLCRRSKSWHVFVCLGVVSVLRLRQGWREHWSSTPASSRVKSNLLHFAEQVASVPMAVTAWGVELVLFRSLQQERCEWSEGGLLRRVSGGGRSCKAAARAGRGPDCTWRNQGVAQRQYSAWFGLFLAFLPPWQRTGGRRRSSMVWPSWCLWRNNRGKVKWMAWISSCVSSSENLGRRGRMRS